MEINKKILAIPNVCLYNDKKVKSTIILRICLAYSITACEDEPTRKDETGRMMPKLGVLNLTRMMPRLGVLNLVRMMTRLGKMIELGKTV